MIQDAVFILFTIILIHKATFLKCIASKFHTFHIQRLLWYWYSVHLFLKTKQICFFYPNSPVFLIWFSSCTHPNIMHFPSPENLHTAQQTDKYLIGQPSVPSPHGSIYSGHESITGSKCHVSLWESKPMWGQSPPCSPVNASPAGAGWACLPGYKHGTDARAKQMNKHKGSEQLQGVAALSR